MKTIKMTFHGKPEAKQRPRVATRDRCGAALARPHGYTPAKTKAAEFDLRMRAYNQKPATPPTGPVKLKIAVFKPWTQKNKPRKAAGSTIARRVRVPAPGTKNGAVYATDSNPATGPWPTTRPDWDNYGKLVSDAFNGLFYQDDSQIIEATVTKHYSDTPRLEVEISYPEARAK